MFCLSSSQQTECGLGVVSPIPIPPTPTWRLLMCCQPGCQAAFLAAFRGEAWPAAGPSPASSLSTAKRRRDQSREDLKGALWGEDWRTGFGVRCVMSGCLFKSALVGTSGKSFTTSQGPCPLLLYHSGVEESYLSSHNLCWDSVAREQDSSEFYTHFPLLQGQSSCICVIV